MVVIQRSQQQEDELAADLSGTTMVTLTAKRTKATKRTRRVTRKAQHEAETKDETINGAAGGDQDPITPLTCNRVAVTMLVMRQSQTMTIRSQKWGHRAGKPSVLHQHGKVAQQRDLPPRRQC
uniref:Uncharacterized protein n=1 Tax=Phytophthora fragariae TaxID=53985 RepID=A0A6A3ERH2_9STRA|nr:hypothetical protein PF009_g14889 [Phytophthora fragariae]